VIINHNIAALNTYRQLSANGANTQKALEKLSSGLRINKAGDDAAGLAISEKMRGQIRGLDQASRNAQDGISLIQTAEGALNETHSILQRMRELAVQSSNDTNTTVDRSEIQKEVDQLSQELSRIGKNTEFNTQTLLDGGFKGTFHIGANESQNLSLSIDDMRGFALSIAGDAEVEIAGTYTIDAAGLTDQDIADDTYVVAKNKITDKYEILDSDGTALANSSDGKSWTITAGSGDDTLSFADAVIDGEVTISGTGTAITGTSKIINNGLQAGDYTVDTDGSSYWNLTDGNGEVIATSTDGTSFTSAQDGTTTVLTVTTTALADDATVKVGGIDVSSQNSADKAITTIQSAIETVSAERSKLGSYQNRLEHTINNLGTSSENLTAAESRVRDVDMAKEMMEFTKNNILSQAAQAMLAQANQQPQGVLQLLR